MARKVITANGETFLETKEGSGDYRKVVEPFGVFIWREGAGIYHLRDVVRLFKSEKSADRFANANSGKNYVVRTLRYVHAD